MYLGKALCGDVTLESKGLAAGVSLQCWDNRGWTRRLHVRELWGNQRKAVWVVVGWGKFLMKAFHREAFIFTKIDSLSVAWGKRQAMQ